MKEEQYTQELTAVLSLHTATLKEKIWDLVQHVPEEAIELDIIIFPNQEGDGSFDIRAFVTGPDQYVLNQVLEPWANLFGVIYTEDGVEPEVPIVNIFLVDFTVNDSLIDIVAQWIASVWEELEFKTTTKPVYVLAHDDYGTITPLQLQ